LEADGISGQREIAGSSAEFVGLPRDTEVVTGAAIGAGDSGGLAVARDRAQGPRLAVGEGLLRGGKLLGVAVEADAAARCQLEPVAPIQTAVRRPRGSHTGVVDNLAAGSDFAAWSGQGAGDVSRG